MTIRTLALAATLATLGLQAFTASAQAPAPVMREKQAGYLRVPVGGIEVIALSDGTLNLPMDQLLTNAQPGEVQKLLAQAYLTTAPHTSVNAFLVVAGDRRVLVDAGAGGTFGPTLGKLVSSLVSAGHRPEQITDVLITHLHGDHSGGLLDAAGGRAFVNATLRADRREVEYWTSEANLQKVPKERQGSFRTAMRIVAAYREAGKLAAFDGATELLPGMRALPGWGHTPGHSFYVIENQGEKMVFWGDVMHVADVQFPRPEITIQFDVDSAAAAKRRADAFAEAAKQGYLVAVSHNSFPGIGRLRASGDGYRWYPVSYVNDAHAAR